MSNKSCFGQIFRIPKIVKSREISDIEKVFELTDVFVEIFKFFSSENQIETPLVRILSMSKTIPLTTRRLQILHSARDPRKKFRRDRVGEEGENRDGGQNSVGTERSTKGNIAWKNFETYYRTQLPLPPHELDLFFKSLRTPLPVTFRLVLPSSGSEANSQAVSAFEKRVSDALAAGAGRLLPL